MIDVSISELGLIGLVILLVVGPKRLPAVVQRIGFFLVKTRKMVEALKAEGEKFMLSSSEKPDKKIND